MTSCGTIGATDQDSDSWMRIVANLRAPVPSEANFFMCFALCDTCSYCAGSSHDCKRKQDNDLIRSKFGQIIPLEWKWKSKCKPHFDTTFTGTYNIRITGECPDSLVLQKTNGEQENEGHP
jgi:hypothetical protein